VDNQQALELLHRYHDATNAGALDELDDIFADDFINFAAGFEPVKSLAAMKTLIRELLVAFPLGLQQLHRRLQQAQGSRREIARMPALVASRAPIAHILRPAPDILLL